MFVADRITEGERIPRWYGVAWRDATRLGTIVYPIPLNLIARWATRFWMRVRMGGNVHWLEIQAAQARRLGFEEGRIAARRDLQVSFERGFDRGYLAHGEALQDLFDRKSEEEVRTAVQAKRQMEEA